MTGAIYNIQQAIDGPKISIEKVFEEAGIEISKDFRANLKNCNIAQDGVPASLTLVQATHLRKNGFNVRLQIS